MERHIISMVYIGIHRDTIEYGMRTTVPHEPSGRAIMAKRVNHVGIAVADIVAADAFMVNVLGLERASRPIDDGMTAAFYRCGEIDIQIVQDTQRMHPAPFGRIDHIAIDVDDLDELQDRLRANGAELKYASPLLNGPPVTKRTQFTVEGPGSLGVAFQLTDRNPRP